MSLDETNPPILPPAEPSFAERWVADFRLLAVQCAKAYGVLTIGALIALNALAWSVTQEDQHVVGAAVGVGAAFAAYVNFSVIAADGPERIVQASMVVSIACGVCAALIFLGAAF